MSEVQKRPQNIENNQDIQKKVDNPFSQENIARKIAKEPLSVQRMASKEMPKDLKAYAKERAESLFDWKETNEKTPGKIRNEIVDWILKEKLWEKYEKYIKTWYTKEVLREKYLESNKKILVAKDKDWKEIKSEKYIQILEKNKNFAKLNTDDNPNFTKELLIVYWEKEIEWYEWLIETVWKRWEKLPTTLEEFDSFIDEKAENFVSYGNTSKKEIWVDIENYKKIIEANPNNEKAKWILGFLEKLFNMDWNFNNFYNWNLWKLPEWLEEIPPSIRKVLEVAMSQVWVNEMDGSADKYLQEIWHTWRRSAWDKNAWCAAFVNWTLMKSWMDYNSSLASQSFINWAWKWHVWFKVWNQLLWWNQSDMVSLKPLNLGKVKWWVMPDNRWEIHRRGDNWFDQNKIPDWAILVFSSSKSTR